MKNLLVAQSGGPSVAINATVAGVVEKSLISSKIDKIYGAVNGIQGVLEETLVRLDTQLNSPEKLQLLCQTPSAALGSCRFKMKGYDQDEASYQKIIDTLRKYDIGYFIYIGGNDSMDTVHKLSEYCALKGVTDIMVMGAPKTIDNDLCETDHCPGFGSAAKYVATTLAELRKDCDVYKIPAVTIVEIMGRNAGWLTAAAALSRVNGGQGPQLIYLCERTFDLDTFLADIQACLAKNPAVMIAISEGIKDKDGNYIADSQQSGALDSFGHKILAGAATFLEQFLRDKLGCKVRAVQLNLMQRCAAHLASATDIYESRMLGITATDRALDGVTGQMAAIKRLSSNPYTVSFTSAEIAKIANFEKTVPDEWINAAGNDVTQELVDYMLPLIQGEPNTICHNGIPAHISLY